MWRSVTCLIDGRDVWLDLDGVTHRFSEPDPLTGGGRKDDPRRVVAPVTGLVRSVGVQAGGRVEEGQFLAVIEAMKMETTLAARIAGTVRAVHVVAGEQARAGDLMIEIEADG